MNILYYWIMGICIGTGIGSLISSPIAAVINFIGLAMAILSVGWYGQKAWKESRE